ncbi:hypothetical protein FXW78_46295 [Rhodococcus opacus]|nr:hypothetical protein [Rhodococcus opacus]
MLYGHHPGTTGHADVEPGVLSFTRHTGHTFGILGGGDRGTFWFARLTRPPLPPTEVGLHASQDWTSELNTAFPTPVLDVHPSSRPPRPSTPATTPNRYPTSPPGAINEP